MQATNAAVRVPTTTLTFTPPIRRRRSPALVLMALGVALVALAAGVLASASHGAGHRATAPAAAAAAPVVAPAGLTIQSPGDITVLNMTYEPGQSSGWHMHRGIHAVAIISGELTVYDQNCVAHTYGPNEPYIGGQQLHLVRNETANPATMVVTYVNPVQPASGHGAPVPAPTVVTPPCDVR